MRRLTAGSCLLALCVGAAINANAAQASTACPVPQLSVCPAPLDKTMPDVKDMLTWNQQDRVLGFRNDYRAYPGDVFKAGQPRPIPVARQSLSSVSYEYHGHKYSLNDYLKRNNVTGMMVIKNGKIVWDYYGAGNTKTTLWTSRSVGKSVVSTLVGIALKEGKIASLNDELVKYNPAVKGTAWEHITIYNMLNMTSGITWNEDYTDPNSDFSKLTQCEANANTYDCVSKLLLSPDRKAYAKQGEVWQYDSGGAWLLGDTLEKATGETIAQYLQDKIWQPYGMVQDGVWQSYWPGKHDVGAHGFNATLEDWGKFGLFVLNNGVLPNGTQMLPSNWVHNAQIRTKAKNSVSAGYPNGIYGYQWWNGSVPADAKNVAPRHGISESALWAEGIYGQQIVVDQKNNLVIVAWSSWPKAEPAEDAQPLESSLMFNAIANKLAR